MSRELSSIAFEADYWLAVSRDLSAVNDQIVDAAAPLVDASVQVVALAVALIGSPRGGRELDVISTTISQTLVRLYAIQQQINGIGELLDGRLVALREEADLPAPEPS